MPTNYQYRYVELIKEASYGVIAGGISVTGEVDDESLQHQFDLMTRADMSYLGAKKSLAGKTHSEGGINLVCQPDDFCAMIMRGIYNKYTFATGTSHLFEEDMAVATGLPSFGLKIGRELKEHLYTGMCITRVSMSANVGEYVTMSADFTGLAEDDGTPASLNTSPTFVGGTEDGYHFAGAEVFFDNGATTTNAGALIKSFSIEWNTNLNTDSCTGLGSRVYSVQPAPQMREITGTLEFSRPVMAAPSPVTEQPTYYDTQTAAGLVYDPAGSLYAINLRLTSGAKIVNIYVNKCIWEAATNNVSGREASSMSLSFTALVDADDVMSSVLWTTQSATTLA